MKQKPYRFGQGQNMQCSFLFMSYNSRYFTGFDMPKKCPAIVLLGQVLPNGERFLINIVYVDTKSRIGPITYELTSRYYCLTTTLQAQLNHCLIRICSAYWVLPEIFFSCGSSEPRNSSSCGLKKSGNCHFFYACRCHKALISET